MANPFDTIDSDELERLSPRPMSKRPAPVPARSPGSLPQNPIASALRTVGVGMTPPDPYGYLSAPVAEATSTVTPTAYDAGVAQPQAHPVQPGVSTAPVGRPGIQTTIYRHEPGTRHFIFDDNGLEIPGAGARLEGRLNYNQQLMDAIQQAGGTLENSPQFAGLAAQNASGWNALNTQTEAGAHQMAAQAELQKGSPENMAMAALMKSLDSDPTLLQEPTFRAKVGIPRTMDDMGLGNAPDLKRAIPAMKAVGIQGMTEGSPEHLSLMAKHSPEVQALLSGSRFHNFGWGDITPAEYRAFVHPSEPVANPGVAAPKVITPNVGVNRVVRRRDAMGRPIEEAAR